MVQLDTTKYQPVRHYMSCDPAIQLSLMQLCNLLDKNSCSGQASLLYSAGSSKGLAEFDGLRGLLRVRLNKHSLHFFMFSSQIAKHQQNQTHSLFLYKILYILYNQDDKLFLCLFDRFTYFQLVVQLNEYVCFSFRLIEHRKIISKQGMPPDILQI